MSLTLVKALLILNANPRGCNQYKPCSGSGKSPAKGKAKAPKKAAAKKKSNSGKEVSLAEITKRNAKPHRYTKAELAKIKQAKKPRPGEISDAEFKRRSKQMAKDNAAFAARFKKEPAKKASAKGKAGESTKGASGPTSASNLQSNFEKSSGLKGVKFASGNMGSSKSAYGDAKLSKAAEKHAKTAGFREIKGPTLSSKATHRWFVDPHGNKMTIATPNKGESGKHQVSFTESNKHYLAEVKKAKAARGSK